jgi:hypothetical protein
MREHIREQRQVDALIAAKVLESRPGVARIRRGRARATYFRQK